MFHLTPFIATPGYPHYRGRRTRSLYKPHPTDCCGTLRLKMRIWNHCCKDIATWTIKNETTLESTRATGRLWTYLLINEFTLLQINANILLSCKTKRVCFDFIISFYRRHPGSLTSSVWSGVSCISFCLLTRAPRARLCLNVLFVRLALLWQYIHQKDVPNEKSCLWRDIHSTLAGFSPGTGGYHHFQNFEG